MGKKLIWKCFLYYLNQGSKTKQLFLVSWKMAVYH